MLDLKNCILKENNEKTSFNCIEQQYMTLCLYINNDYWKLFLEDNLQLDNNENKYIDKKFFRISNHKKILSDLYGIYLLEVNKIDFSFENIYLVITDFKNYPFTMKFEEKGKHGYLIYHEEKKSYIVCDNYYGVTSYKLSKSFLKNKNHKIKKVIFKNSNKIDKNLIKQKIIDKFSRSYYSVINEIYNLLKEKIITKCKKDVLTDKILDIHSLLKKDVLIVKNISEDDYILKCGEILDEIAIKIKRIWYSIIKEIIKNDRLSIEFLTKKFEDMKNLLFIEAEVKNEICNILNNKNSIKNLLSKQLKCYLKTKKNFKFHSAYDDHEGFAIMYMIDYFEKKNSLKDINFDEFKNLKYYNDFLLVIYRKYFWNKYKYTRKL